MKPERWFSIDCTKRSMPVTKASAARMDCWASSGPSRSHRPRCTCQSDSTLANSRSTSSSQGTNSGRLGSPARSRPRLWSNCATSAATSGAGSPACTALARRQVCMRMRPASLTAAAPPSSCQVTHKVKPIEVSATMSRPAPMRTSLVDREAVDFMGIG